MFRGLQFSVCLEDYRPPLRLEVYRSPLCLEDYHPPLRLEVYRSPLRLEGYHSPLRLKGYRRISLGYKINKCRVGGVGKYVYTGKIGYR